MNRYLSNYCQWFLQLMTYFRLWCLFKIWNAKLESCSKLQRFTIRIFLKVSQQLNCGRRWPNIFSVWILFVLCILKTPKFDDCFALLGNNHWLKKRATDAKEWYSDIRWSRMTQKSINVAGDTNVVNLWHEVSTLLEVWTPATIFEYRGPAKEWHFQMKDYAHGPELLLPVPFHSK